MIFSYFIFCILSGFDSAFRFVASFLYFLQVHGDFCKKDGRGINDGWTELSFRMYIILLSFVLFVILFYFRFFSLNFFCLARTIAIFDFPLCRYFCVRDSSVFFFRSHLPLCIFFVTRVLHLSHSIHCLASLVLSFTILLRLSCRAYSLKLSLLSLKHLRDRDPWENSNGVRYPQQLPLVHFEHVDRGWKRRIGSRCY